MKKILLLGVPRTGTTWVGDIIGLSQNMEYVLEPDNEKTSLLAYCLKRELMRFPVLSQEQHNPFYSQFWQFIFNAPEAALLSRSTLTRLVLFKWLRKNVLEKWVTAKEHALTTTTENLRTENLIKPPLQKTINLICPLLSKLVHTKQNSYQSSKMANARLVKSVHGILASEWIVKTCNVTDTIITMRSPYAVLASWRKLKMPDALRAGCLSQTLLTEVFGETTTTIEQQCNGTLTKMAMQLAVMYRTLEAVAKRNPQWIVLHHETLCRDPLGGFEELYSRLNLSFNDDVIAGIKNRNREGHGYKAVRVANKEIGKWRGAFSAMEIDEINRVLTAARLEHWIE